MDAAAAIATEATHGPSHPACQATRHTWQVAHQVAVANGLRSAAQHRRRGRPIVLTMHNVTTARDLQPHQAGARRRTSHGQLARNNLSMLQGLNATASVGCRTSACCGPSSSGACSAASSSEGRAGASAALRAVRRLLPVPGRRDGWPAARKRARTPRVCRKAGAERGPGRDGAIRLIESRIVLELQSARGIRSAYGSIGT